MIPKVSGYSGFNSYGGLPYSSLKPGQVKLDRDYYKDVSKHDKNALKDTYNRFVSNQQNTVDKAVKPSDYKAVSRSGKQNLQYEYLHDPELYKHTKVGRMQQSTGIRASTELRNAATTNLGAAQTNGATSPQKMYKTTSHWKSNYADENQKAQERPSSQAQRPFWSYPKRQHVARRQGTFKTEYHNTLGTYGHNPRAILNSESTKMESEVNDLTMGSTKVTNHIPGYSGFLVKTDLNDKALAHGKNQYGRDLMKSKVNMNENFNVRIAGYSGYKPMSCLNDRGTVRPQLFSTQGEKFF
jgi:hypothetical protein